MSNKCIINNSKKKTDYELIAESFDVTPAAVKQAVKRRNKYPRSRLFIAYEELQQSKRETVKKMAAKKKPVKK